MADHGVDGAEATVAARSRFLVELEVLEKKFDRSGRPLFISDEEICGCLPGLVGYGEVFPSFHRIAFEVAKFFSGYQIVFIVYEREFSSWIRSAYNQAVKTDGQTKSFDEYRSCIEVDGLELCSRRLQGEIGERRVIRVKMEHEVSQADLGDTILRILGVPKREVDAFKRVSESNKSLSPRALELMRRLNASISDRGALDSVRRVIVDSDDIL